MQRDPYPLRVLVVDDNASDQLLTQEAFAELAPDCSIELASNASEALMRLQRTNERRPNLILLDVNMPGLNGFELLRTLKADPRLALIPVVMLTTSSNTEDVARAYTLYASAYLSKATSFEGFLAQIDAFLQFWRIARFPDPDAPVRR